MRWHHFFLGLETVDGLRNSSQRSLRSSSSSAILQQEVEEGLPFGLIELSAIPSCFPLLPLLSFSENSKILEQCISSSSSSLSMLGSSSRFQLPSSPVDTVLLSSPSTKAVLSSSLTKLSSFYILNYQMLVKIIANRGKDCSTTYHCLFTKACSRFSSALSC